MFSMSGRQKNVDRAEIGQLLLCALSAFDCSGHSVGQLRRRIKSQPYNGAFAFEKESCSKLFSTLLQKENHDKCGVFRKYLGL